jgi:hypothetical protein
MINEPAHQIKDEISEEETLIQAVVHIVAKSRGLYEEKEIDIE